MKIDWREQVNTLESYLDHRGGVLGIGGAPTSAYESFITLVAEIFEARNEGNKCVRLIPSHLATHTSSDIITMLEDELGVEYDQPVGPPVKTNVNVASGIKSRAPVTIENVESNVNVFTGLRGESQVKRTKRIIAKTRESLSSCRLALVLDDCPHMPDDSFMWFWHELWKRGLKELTGRGLLILCGSITSNGNYQHRTPAQTPDDVITLPVKYDGDNYLHALEDISTLLASELAETLQDARIRAETLLKSTWSLLPDQTHNNLYTEILKLKQRI